MKIVLLGSGNMATRLAIAFKAAGHHVAQIWSRNMPAASELAAKVGAEAVASMNELNQDATVYILAVSDDAISAVASTFPFKERLLVHTSGATSLDQIRPFSNCTGVFYPLQTLSKQKSVDFLDIPVGIEGSDAEVSDILLKLAATISEKATLIDSGQRMVLHVAAVFACNFTNHLYAIAEKMLSDYHMSFDLLRPLIEETARKAQFFSPATVQTGPAARNDVGTINRHLDLLQKEDGRLIAMYEMLTDSIQDLSRQKSER